MIRPTIFFVGDFGEPFDKLKALSLPKGSAEPLAPSRAWESRIQIFSRNVN